MPIDDKPILGRWLDHLEINGCTNAIVNTHYLHKQVNNYIEEYDSKKMKVSTSFEDKLLELQEQL